MTSATPDRTPSGRRLAHLDGLRAIASLFVLLHHTYCMAYPLSLGVMAQGLTAVFLGWMAYGHFGVTIFIVLAGFSLALGIAGKEGRLPGGVVGFMQRRAWRIIPPYWAAIAVTAALVSTVIGEPTRTHWDLALPTDHLGWLADFVLLQDVMPGRDIAYPFWSIAVEWHIYLLLPIMLLVRRLTSSWRVAITFGVAGSLLIVGAARLVPELNNLAPQYYALFALSVGGCVAVRLKADALARLPLLAVAVVGLMGVVGVCLGRTYAWAQDNFYWLDLVLGISVLALVIHTAVRQDSRCARALAWRPLASVGLFSYSIYLVHAPLLAVAWRFAVQPADLSRNGQLALGWLVVAPVVVAVAYLFYRLFEKPFINRRPARSRADAAATPVVTGLSPEAKIPGVA